MEQDEFIERQALIPVVVELFGVPVSCDGKNYPERFGNGNGTL